MRGREDYTRLTPHNFIDEQIFDKLRKVNLEPFPVSGGRTFVRRVYLDAIGVLPTPEEPMHSLTTPAPASAPV